MVHRVKPLSVPSIQAVYVVNKAARELPEWSKSSCGQNLVVAGVVKI